jgi:L-lactate permease
VEIFIIVSLAGLVDPFIWIIAFTSVKLFQNIYLSYAVGIVIFTLLYTTLSNYIGDSVNVAEMAPKSASMLIATVTVYYLTSKARIRSNNHLRKPAPER